jgi:enterochelin esterase family protein
MYHPAHSILRRFLLAAVIAFCAVKNASAQEPRIEVRYGHGPDSVRHKGVPKGSVTRHEWNDSKVFPNTKREYYIYVPARYDREQPAALTVFQDGRNYIRDEGDFRAPVVFDNLIHKKEMPVTIGVFINPGGFKDKSSAKGGGKPGQENRSFEYDTLSGDYAKFLLSEILPEVAKEHPFTDDPEGRAICGSSSGGICAFTVAWQRPDQFRKVLSTIGSFTNIRGGDAYPGMIRKGSDKKPIRVFLQDGSNDLDNAHGNWPLANKQMYAALKFRGYDVNFVYGEGAHNGNHGGAIFPDALRWLWRDYKLQ